MAGRPSSLKYLIGLIVAIALSAGLFVCVLNQAKLRSQDVRTQNRFYDIENKLYSYSYDKQLVPGSLAEAGIKKVPPSITYKKLSRASYRLCAAYKSSGFTYDHKSKSCQDDRIHFKIFIKNGDGTYTVCGVKTDYYDREGYIVKPTMKRPGVIDVGGQLFFFTAHSQAFDEKCDELKKADLKIGDRVDVFSIVPKGSHSSASIFLKRS